MERLAPHLGFSGYQPLARQYIGKERRADLARLDREVPIPQLVGSLKRRGVDERSIAKAITEVPSASPGRPTLKTLPWPYWNLMRI